MYTENDLLAAFKGALVLDMLRPGWDREIESSYDLWISDPSRCPLALAYGSYWKGLRAFGFQEQPSNYAPAEETETVRRMGFNSPSREEDWNLSDAWRALLLLSS